VCTNVLQHIMTHSVLRFVLSVSSVVNKLLTVQLIKAWSRTIRSDIHKSIGSIWNYGKLPEEWEEWIIVPIYKKGDTTDCSNYCCVG
jgi:hypothetical protein